MCVQVDDAYGRRMYGSGGGPDSSGGGEAESGGMLLFPAQRPACVGFSASAVARSEREMAVVAALRFEGLAQNAFNEIQVALAPLWDPEYVLFSNVAVLRTVRDEQSAVASSSGDASSSVQAEGVVEARGMVLRRDDGELRVLCFGAEAEGVERMVSRVLERVAARGLERVKLERVGEDTSRTWLYSVAKRMPWSFVHGAKFVSEGRESNTWHQVSEASLRAFGLNDDEIQEMSKQFFRYLSDSDLARMGLPASTDTSDRCVKLAARELEQLQTDDALRVQFEQIEYTELTSREQSKVRADEYDRVMRSLSAFMGQEAVNELHVERVIVFRNPVLELQFTACYEDLSSRLRSDSAKREWREQYNAFNPLEQYMVDSMRRYLHRETGSEHVNLVQAWHGADLKYQLMNAVCGMRKMPPLSDEQRRGLADGSDSGDYGWHGRGVYFTQFPSYGTVFIGNAAEGAAVDAALPEPSVTSSSTTSSASTSPSSATSGATASGAGGGGSGGLKPLLLSHVLMGRPYPVTVSKDAPFHENMHGKECPSGFDSCYSLVRGGRANMDPIRMHADGSIDAPQADELVVFNPCQVLPYCLVLCRSRSSVQGPSGAPLLLVVDPHPDEVLLEWVAHNGNVEVRRFVSTADVIAWLSQHWDDERYEKLKPLHDVVQRGAVRLVTNRTRAVDGGRNAAKSVIDAVKNLPEPLNSIPVLVFCGALGNLLEQIQERNERVLVSTSEEHFKRFGSLEPLTWDMIMPIVNKYFESVDRLHSSAHWKPDQSAKHCSQCDTKFSLFNRRHHCRYCGNIFCSQHAPEMFGVRLCSQCQSEI
eukprot:TRINITY_DN577_c1_g1_i4.p1 TRINITY_DN577_c1_g1~~TRINITY_DN577_c1_g1_i4.p1  ORF type:complete len:820 (-),score=231.25 TRINITY_DN577_c1_g1_i4:213-2672(-)